MAKIGVGIIGANVDSFGGYGSWGAWTHLPALASLENFETIAVATTRQQSAEKTAARFAVPHAFDNWRALVAHPQVQVVAICVRVPAHRELVLASIEAGKHVYCEWPLARSTQEAEEMLRAATASGVSHAVGLQARSSPVLRYLRHLIADGMIGTVRSAFLSHSSDWLSQVTPENVYLQDRSTGAHFLSIPGGHSIDALCWLLGEYTTLQATIRTSVPTLKMSGTGELVRRTSADQVLVGGVLQNGALASVRLSAATPHGTGVRIEISGDGGDLVAIDNPGLHGLQLSELTLYRSQGAGELVPLEVPDSYFRAPPAVRHTAAQNVAEAYLAFADRIAGREVDLPDFADGVARHRTLDRIESAAGLTITL